MRCCAADSLLDILQRFMHLEVIERTVDTPTGKKVRKESMIFPRYHQFDSVRKLVAHAPRTEGRAQLPDPCTPPARGKIEHHRMAGASAGQPA